MNQRGTLQRLFSYSRPYRGLLIWAGVGMLMYAAGETGLPALIKIIIDQVLPRQQNHVRPQRSHGKRNDRDHEPARPARRSSPDHRRRQ